MKSIFSTILICILSVHISNAQWEQVSNGMGNKIVYSLAVNGNNLFAGTWNAGVYLSTNNGTSWSQTSFNNRDVRSLAVNGNNVYAGTAIYGIYLSTNNGTNWSQTSLNNQNIWSLAVSGNNIFAGTENNGVYISTDSGANWTPTSLINRYVHSLAVNGNYIFAGTDFYGVYVSTNNGTNWTQTSLINRWIYSLAANGNNVYAGSHNAGVFLSTDNGSNWTPTSLNNLWVYSLAVRGSNIFAGTISYGVYVSNDNGATWTQRNEGLGSSYGYALCTLNNDIFVGTYNSVYRRPLNEITPPPLILNLKALIQGFYDPITNKMVKDTVRVYLRSSSSPYTLVDSASGILDSNGMGSFIFPTAVNSVPYYIVIKHRNGLETWSAAGNNFTAGSLTYDFTLSSSQAYGNNQILKGTRYCIHNGDVNQDGIIDISDLGLTDNDSFYFLTGYLNTDINGDNFVDVTDLELTENNAINFIVIQRP
ncbi:MAG: hypothetical protein M3R36_01665 [Bacteroidota bacterium]|nr:hypothetical protein [Bacteroidota bacterium]